MKKRKRVTALLLALCMMLSGCSGLLDGLGGGSWQEQYDLGMRCLEDGDYQEAILAFSAAIEIDPDRPEAYMGRAEAYIGIEEPEKALKDYKKAKRIARGDDAYSDLLEDLEELIEELEDIIADEDEDIVPESAVRTPRLTRVETRSGGVLIYRDELSYDEYDRLTQVVSEVYSETGNLLSRNTNRFFYDDGGRLSRINYGETGEAVYTYDEAGRLLEYSYTDGGWYNAAYTYDENGWLTQSVEESQGSSSVTIYTCDEQGNILEEYIVTTHEYGTSEAWVSYTYNEFGEVTGKTEQWAEGIHHTAYSYLNGLVAERVTYDYTEETDYTFRLRDVTGQSLWVVSVQEGSYTVDDLNRVNQAVGRSYDGYGLVEVVTDFYYDDVEAEVEQEPENQEQPAADKQETINALNALLSGTRLDMGAGSVLNWDNSTISSVIYGKLKDDYFHYGDDSYLRGMGLTWSEQDGFLHFPLDKVQELTKDAYGRDFPMDFQNELMQISGGDLLVSIAIGESEQLLVQDYKWENGTVTAVGTAVYTWNTGREFRGYFRATFRQNPDCVYGFTLLSLEKTEENQDFSILIATASSELSGSGYTHYASYVLDGRLDTAWSEGVSGVGINEWILLETSNGSKMEIAAIEVAVGYHKSERTLERNGWPWEVLIECEGGFQKTAYFYYYSDVLVLDHGVETSWIKITILNADAGTHYEDTCISEIRLRGLDTSEDTPAAVEDAYGQYKQFFYNNYADTDIVYLADVTHDGVEDMVVVNFSDEYRSVVYGHVYTIRNGVVTEIYSKQGSDYHAGGFFAWYLVPVPDSDYWNLASESFGMWQGVGSVTYSEYILTNEGYAIEVNYLELDSSVEGNHDASGMVTDGAWSAYTKELNEELANCFRIYCSSSNGSGSKALDTSPASVFGK